MSVGVPMLSGAKISLGGVNITGREFEDYSVSEAAYLVGRYMVQNSEHGGVWYGSVFTVLNKLWPYDFDDPAKFTGTKFSKLLYYWLRQFGFKNRRSAEYGTIWYCPTDVDDNYKTRMEKSEEKKEIPSPVVYRCVCGAGPYEEKNEFVKHREEFHPKEPDKEELEEQVVKTPEVTSTPANLNIGWRQKKLLVEILKNEGQFPRTYAATMGIRSGAVGSAAKFLARHGFIMKTGAVQTTRYFLTDEGRKAAQQLNGKGKVRRKATPKAKPQPKQPELPFPKAEAVIEKSVMPGIPAGMDAKIYETKDGSWIVVTTEGNTYFVAGAIELANK